MNQLFLASENLRRGTGQIRANNARKVDSKNAPSAYETIQKLQAVERNERAIAARKANSDDGILANLGSKEQKLLSTQVFGMSIKPDVRALLKAGELKKALEYLGKTNANGIIPSKDNHTLQIS